MISPPAWVFSQLTVCCYRFAFEHFLAVQDLLNQLFLVSLECQLQTPAGRDNKLEHARAQQALVVDS